MEGTRNTRHLLLCAVVAALPAIAAGQEAHALKRVNVRAGPARDYPLAVTFGLGTRLAVQGCSDAYGWCDVIGPGDRRGWICAGNIGYPY